MLYISDKFYNQNQQQTSHVSHEKPSVRPHFARIFCVKWISAVAAWIDIKLARNESQVFKHQQVCFEKFLTYF